MWAQTMQPNLATSMHGEKPNPKKNTAGRPINGPENKRSSTNTTTQTLVIPTKHVLDAEDDAATVNWGKKWRTPTNEELTELRIHCNWEWTRNYNGTGAVGRIGISKTNGNIIFLPAGGYRFSTNVKSDNEDGGYWSSTLCDNYYYRSYSFNFRDINIEWHHSRRFSGRNVRPVLIKK